YPHKGWLHHLVMDGSWSRHLGRADEFALKETFQQTRWCIFRAMGRDSRSSWRQWRNLFQWARLCQGMMTIAPKCPNSVCPAVDFGSDVIQPHARCLFSTLGLLTLSPDCVTENVWYP